MRSWSLLLLSGVSHSCVLRHSQSYRVHPRQGGLARIVEEYSECRLDREVTRQMQEFESLTIPGNDFTSRSHSSGGSVSPVRVVTDHGHSDHLVCPSRVLWRDLSHEKLPDAEIPGGGSVLSRLSHWRWPFGERTIISLGRLIERSADSTTYGIHDFGNAWALRYTVYCPEVRTPDPATRDYENVLRISQMFTDVTLTSLFVSEPLRMPSLTGGKIDTTTACNVNKRELIPLVRYTIMERAVMTLETYLSTLVLQWVPLRQAAIITLQVLRLLQKLHSIGVVHGNLHLKNIVVRNTVPRTLALQNFESAIFDSSQPVNNAQSLDSISPLCSAYASHWELNERPGYRDDIFRALQVMAVLIHGSGYVLAFDRVCADVSNIANFLWYTMSKHNLNIFNISVRLVDGQGNISVFGFLLGQVNGVPIRALPDIVDSLNEILSVARKPISRFQPPEYDLIETLLGRIIVSL